MHHVAMHVRQAEVAPLVAVGQTPVIDSGEVQHYRVVIVGGGPIGLASAVDLAGHRAEILKQNLTRRTGAAAQVYTGDLLKSAGF